eukprot:11555-Heterococcus_DN1.PRE.1
MSGKRPRENGQLSKIDYEIREASSSQQYHAARAYSDRCPPTLHVSSNSRALNICLVYRAAKQPGHFTRAGPRTLAGRAIIASTRNNRHDYQLEYDSQVRTLNESLTKFVHRELARDDSENLTLALHEYTEQAERIKDRYQRYHGTVLACGNSDCGQVGLGEEEEEKNVALLTPLPTLAGKRITYVACGGISSVVCTADGRVFSWGCNDDGALGRASATDTVAKFMYSSARVALADAASDTLRAVGVVSGVAFAVVQSQATPHYSTALLAHALCMHCQHRSCQSTLTALFTSSRVLTH